jgi:hypothetical protein
MLPNEGRELLGLPQIEGGNEPLQLKPEQVANDNADRQRDTERTNNQSDGPATVSGRNPKGEGRKVDDVTEMSE